MPYIMPYNVHFNCFEGYEKVTWIKDLKDGVLKPWSGSYIGYASVYPEVYGECGKAEDHDVCWLLK